MIIENKDIKQTGCPECNSTDIEKDCVVDNRREQWKCNNCNAEFIIKLIRVYIGTAKVGDKKCSNCIKWDGHGDELGTCSKIWMETKHNKSCSNWEGK